MPSSTISADMLLAAVWTRLQGPASAYPEQGTECYFYRALPGRLTRTRLAHILYISLIRLGGLNVDSGNANIGCKAYASSAGAVYARIVHVAFSSDLSTSGHESTAIRAHQPEDSCTLCDKVCFELQQHCNHSAPHPKCDARGARCATAADIVQVSTAGPSRDSSGVLI